MRRLLLVLALLFCSQELIAKVRILTFHYNRADFLEYQCQLFEKFMLDDYEIIVINDAVASHHEKSIRDVCDKYGLLCVRFQPEWHNTDPLNEEIRSWFDNPQINSFFRLPLDEHGYPPLEIVAQQCSFRHCHVLQFALEHFGYNHDDIVVILDADVFPIKPISVRNLLIDAPVVGIDSEFKYMHYLWVPFLAFDPKRLPNLHEFKVHVAVIDDILCDTGSNTYHYLKNNPEVPFELFPRRSGYDFYPWDPFTFVKFGFTNPGMANIEWPTPMEYYVDYHLVHFCGGSSDIHPDKKLRAIYDVLNCILND